MTRGIQQQPGASTSKRPVQMPAVMARPPLDSKPQLPMAVLRGASAIDWTTTTIAAFSFLIHFLLLGSLSSDWLDPIVDDEFNVAGVID
jgi:hypothetical protein